MTLRLHSRMSIVADIGASGIGHGLVIRQKTDVEPILTPPTGKTSVVPSKALFLKGWNLCCMLASLQPFGGCIPKRETTHKRIPLQSSLDNRLSWWDASKERSFTFIFQQKRSKQAQWQKDL